MAIISFPSVSFAVQFSFFPSGGKVHFRTLVVGFGRYDGTVVIACQFMPGPQDSFYASAHCLGSLQSCHVSKSGIACWVIETHGSVTDKQTTPRSSPAADKNSMSNGVLKNQPAEPGLNYCSADLWANKMPPLKHGQTNGGSLFNSVQHSFSLHQSAYPVMVSN